MIIIDNFVKNFDRFKKFSLECELQDEINPVDGVAYPHICKDIPDQIRNELLWYLAAVLHRPAKDPIIFLRMSPKGVPCPHIFHTDNSMGAYSLMLYLQDKEGAGTGLCYHKETGLDMAPESDELLQKVIEDQNIHDKWEVYKLAEMKENRAAIFDARLFHCALPFGGFGETREDSRIVITCFFS